MQPAYEAQNLASVPEDPASGVRRTCVLAVCMKARSGLRDAREDSLSSGRAVTYVCLQRCELHGWSAAVEVMEASGSLCQIPA